MLMHYQPIVSICISTWNRLDKLKICIESINKQDYDSIEVVIVDNASDDGTYEFCQQLIKTFHYPIIYKRVETTNDSAMSTLNMGFKSASGQYLCVLDDDSELIDDDIVTQSVNIMNQHLQCFVIAYRVINADMDNELEYTCYHHLNRVPEFFGAGFFVRKDIFEQLGFFDEQLKLYGNELDVSLKAYNAMYYILYAHDLIIYHDRYKSTLFNDRKSKYMLMNSLNAPLKYFDYKHRVMMTFGYGIGHLYYLLFKIKSVATLMWWITWYPRVLFKALLPLHNPPTPLWIQDYYCRRLFNMLKRGV